MSVAPLGDRLNFTRYLRPPRVRGGPSCGRQAAVSMWTKRVEASRLTPRCLVDRFALVRQP
jgi:hypothetical protein